MNHPFIKMLLFELKSNYMMWLFNLIIGLGLLTTLYFKGNAKNSIYPIFIFPIYLLLTWVFTINSYQESTKSQSMQMYHLIPVSRNTKFFSKQFITLVAYPIILAVLTAIFIGIIRIFANTPDVFHESISMSNGSNKINITGNYMLVIWVIGHSVSTFFAIIFKKNKILYSILCYMGFKIALGLILLASLPLLGRKNISTKLFSLTSYPSEDWIIFGLFLISAIFYGLSYHLFFRRQL